MSSSKPILRGEFKIKEYSRDHPYDVILCMDTTGSMASVLKQVKLHAQEIVHELMTKLPSIKMGVSKANKILHLFNYLH